VNKLTTTLPLCAKKIRDGEETKGEIREEIREKMSLPLDSTVVSELVVRVLWWRVCTWWSGSSGGRNAQRGAGPLSFYTLLVPVL